VTAVTEV